MTALLTAPGSKLCTRCSRRQPLSAFPRKVRSRDGRSSWCLACFRVANRAAYRRRSLQGPSEAAGVPSEGLVGVGAVGTSDAPEARYGAPRPSCEPCQVPVCPDPFGGSRHPDGTLIRKGLKRFGLPGKGCQSCYNRLHAAEHPRPSRAGCGSGPAAPGVPAARTQPGRRRPVDLDRPGLEPAEACRTILKLWREGRAWELTGVNEVDDIEGG